jgi:hypothetical protein
MIFGKWNVSVLAIKMVWVLPKCRLCKRDNFSLISLHLEQKERKKERKKGIKKSV